MRPVPWRLLAAAAVSAVLLDLPFPIAGPLPAWRAVFAWFALVPLLIELMRLPSMAGRGSVRWQLAWSFLAGWLCGALWFGANCYWVYDTVRLYGGMNGPLASFSMVLFSLYLGFWFGVFGLALGLVRAATWDTRYARVGLAAVPFLWVSMEFALARVPEFPWDLLGYSQVDSGLLMRLAPWTGVYGISFVVAGVNAWLAVLVAVLVPRRRAFGFGASLFTLVFIFVLTLVRGSLTQPEATATAVLIQPNLDVANDDVWEGAEWDRHMAEFAELGRRSCGDFIAGMPESGAPTVSRLCALPKVTPTLIAWPESPAGYRDVDPKFRAAMAGIVKADRAPMVVGDWGWDFQGPDKYQIYNSASVVNLDGRFVGRYDKTHLVPFGEYVPMRDLLFFAHKLTQNMTDLSTGRERLAFSLKAQDGVAHRYGIFICYESVFGDQVRQFVKNGAEVLVNLSDDGWYGDTSAPWQHLNMARMRAIENRRWILRDTNNGVTASIDPYGAVRQSIPRHQVGALAAGFGYASEMTFYTVHGDWVAWVCEILSLAVVLWSVRVLVAGLRANSVRG